jgi:hypothetical protein
LEEDKVSIKVVINLGLTLAIKENKITLLIKVAIKMIIIKTKEEVQVTLNQFIIAFKSI